MSLATLLALLFFAFAIPVSFGLTLLGEYAMRRIRRRQISHTQGQSADVL